MPSLLYEILPKERSIRSLLYLNKEAQLLMHLVHGQRITPMIHRLGPFITTPRQNVYACARLSISGLFFSHTFLSDQSLPRALGFILCAACGSVVLLHAACVFNYFVLIEIAFMDNQAQITETISRLDSEKVS